MTRSGARVTSRPFSVIFLLLFALSLSGCAQQTKANDPAAQTALAFFELLEEGNAADVSKLLANDSPLLSGDESLLSDELYGATLARPHSAVVESIAASGDQTLVQVAYELEGSSGTRSLTVVLVETDKQLRIQGWSNESLGVVSDFPGAVSLNGIEEIAPNGMNLEIVALPGVYEIEYVDKPEAKRS